MDQFNAAFLKNKGVWPRLKISKKLTSSSDVAETQM